MRFLPVIIFYAFLSFYAVNFLSFSFVEVESIENFPYLKDILNLSFSLFGKNDFALRFPSLFIGFLSVVLFYHIAKLKIKKELLATYIFMLIPGMIIASLIVNKAVYLIFLTLLFVYTYERFRIVSYFLLIAYIFVDQSLISLYLSLVFYSIYKKDGKLLLFSLILLALNANYFEYKIGGKPRGFFLDIFGVYFLIFSPFVFIYFLYSLYKNSFFQKDLIYFITSTAFLMSIILSFRQRIKIDDYAPYILIFVINMFNMFFKSYKIRLSIFRTPYKILFIVLFSSLILFDGLIFFNKYTPLKDLTYSFAFPKKLAFYLKEKKITNIYCNNQKLCEILNFYGIKSGNEYKIILHRKRVSIFHKKSQISVLDVSKINTL